MLYALPEHQGVELIVGQRQWRGLGCDVAWPLEAALVQSPSSAPDPEAVVHQQSDARETGVGEEVAVVRLRGAEACTTLASSRSTPVRMSMG